MKTSDYCTKKMDFDPLEQCIIGLQAETRNEVPNDDAAKTTTAWYQEIEQEPDDENLSSNSRTDTHKLSLCEVISVGKEKVVEMNISKMRENKQRRKKRFKLFLDQLYDKVNNRVDIVSISHN